MYLLEKIDVGIESFLALPLWNSNVSCLPSSSLAIFEKRREYLKRKQNEQISFQEVYRSYDIPTKVEYDMAGIVQKTSAPKSKTLWQRFRMGVLYPDSNGCTSLRAIEQASNTIIGNFFDRNIHTKTTYLRSLSQKSSHLRDFNAGTKSWTLVILALEAFRINSIPSGLDVHACPASTESTLHYVGSFLSLFLWKIFLNFFGFFCELWNRHAWTSTPALSSNKINCLVTESTPLNT